MRIMMIFNMSILYFQKKIISLFSGLFNDKTTISVRYVNLFPKTKSNELQNKSNTTHSFEETISKSCCCIVFPMFPWKLCGICGICFHYWVTIKSSCEATKGI